jgi:hypothetical protein
MYSATFFNVASSFGQYLTSKLYLLEVVWIPASDEHARESRYQLEHYQEFRNSTIVALCSSVLRSVIIFQLLMASMSRVRNIKIT